MVKLVEMDRDTTFARQLASVGEGEIVLFNHFHVDPQDVDVFLELWKVDAEFMLSNGCRSGQLHKGIEGSSSFINVAIWDSAQALARAFRSPEFQSLISRYPESCTATPHVFKRHAIDGVCGA